MSYAQDSDGFFPCPYGCGVKFRWTGFIPNHLPKCRNRPRS